MKQYFSIIGLIGLILFFCAPVSAVPGTMNYQGQIEVQGTPFTGSGYFRFAVVGPVSEFYWSNDGQDPPAEDIVLDVSGGLFEVILGDTLVMNPIPISMFDNDDMFLRVWFDDGITGIQQLSPDQPMTSTGFAFKSGNTNMLNGQVGSYYLEWNNLLFIPPDFADGEDDDQPDDDSEVPDNISINNGRLYAPSGAGNVGIGTTSPGTALEISGEISSTDGVSTSTSSGHALYVGSSGSDGLYINSAGDDGIYVDDTTDAGIYIGDAGSTGIYIQDPVEDGIVIYEAGYPPGHSTSSTPDGIEINGAEGTGVWIGDVGTDGVYVNDAAQNGMWIDNAGHHGVVVLNALAAGIYVKNSGDDGVHIHEVGNPSSTYFDTGDNGIEIAGVQGNGIFIGDTDEHGIYMHHADLDGIYIDDVDQNGMWIDNAAYTGVVIMNAFAYGMYITKSGYDGIHIEEAGNPSITYSSTHNNGIEIGGTQGYGIYIGHTDYDGIYISDAATDGISVRANDDGVSAETDNEFHEYGIYTTDKMFATYGYEPAKLNTFCKNNGTKILEKGDLVSIHGNYESLVLDTSENGTLPVIGIAQTNSVNPASIVGVVEHRVALQDEIDERDQSINKSFRQTPGDIAPGDYLSIVVLGPADVKISEKLPFISGTCLTTGENGGARSVRTTEVNGIVLAENIGILGKAMEDSNGSGMIKVFVNCR